MLISLLMISLAQQAPPAPAAAPLPPASTVKRVSNPRGTISARSPLVLAAEKAKADRAKSAKPPVKIDQESLRTTTGRITVTTLRELPDPPAPVAPETVNSRPIAPQSRAKKPATRAELEGRLVKLRSEMSRVSEDAESESPEGDEDELGQRQEKLRAQIEAVTKQLEEAPQ